MIAFQSDLPKVSSNHDLWDSQDAMNSGLSSCVCVVQSMCVYENKHPAEASQLLQASPSAKDHQLPVSTPTSSLGHSYRTHTWTRLTGSVVELRQRNAVWISIHNIFLTHTWSLREDDVMRSSFQSYVLWQFSCWASKTKSSYIFLYKKL